MNGGNESPRIRICVESKDKRGGACESAGRGERASERAREKEMQTGVGGVGREKLVVRLTVKICI